MTYARVSIVTRLVTDRANERGFEPYLRPWLRCKPDWVRWVSEGLERRGSEVVCEALGFSG